MILVTVVDCPDASYLPAMLASTQLTSHQSHVAESEEHVAAAVVHFSPLEVVRLPQYQEWMDKFPPSTAHLVLNEGNQCQGTTAVHRIQHKLHLLHPTIFPLLSNPKLLANNIHPAAQGDTLFKFQLRPRKGLDK
jgi:ribonuclease Z